jgi:riboflavin transporter FmnP
MLVIYTPVVVALGIVVVVRITTGFPMADLTRDPLQIAQVPVYTGVLSNLGVLVWAGTAAICLFSYAVVRNRAAPGTSSRFLLAGGLVTVMLLLDDFFMFHEIIFPQYIGIPENLVYAIYVLVVAWFLARHRSTILRTNFLLLALALAGFGLMVVMDIFEYVNPLPGFYLLEDGFKLFAIVSWAAYFISTSVRQVGGSK